MNQLLQHKIMKQLPMLLKREFWEHKVAIFYVPLILTILITALIVLSATSASFISVQVEDNGPSHSVTIDRADSSISDIIGPKLEDFSRRSFSHKERVFEEFYTGSSFVLLMTLWFVIFFYLQGALYEDRKDRSILFWKSLPVSDGLTVASKLITALIVIPAIYLVFVAITQLAFLLIASVVAAINSIDIWSTLWAPAHLVTRWFSMMAFFLFTALWCFPLFTWILLVSSWAKSVPFAWVAGVPILLIVLEGMLFRSSDYVRYFIMNHSMTIREIGPGFSHFMPMDYLNLELLLAIAIGGIFTALTIWKRGFANEI